MTSRPMKVWNGSAWEDVTARTAQSTYAAVAPSTPATGDIWVDSSQYTDNWQIVNSGRINGIINNFFDVWQRGTSFAVAASTKTYTADRWMAYRTINTGMTVSRQTGPTGQAYAMRVQRDSGTSATNAMQMYYAMETVDSLRYAGQTCELKLTLKAGANFSAASGNLTISVITGTGTDQSPEASWTNTATALSATQPITTTATSYTFSNIVIPSTATQVKILISFTPVGTASTNDWYEVSAAQFTVGQSVGYERLTYHETLSLCQRYYQAFRTYHYGHVSGAGAAVGCTTSFIKTLRAVPVFTTTLTGTSASAGNCSTTVNVSSGGLTANHFYPYRAGTAIGAADWTTDWVVNVEL